MTDGEVVSNRGNYLALLVLPLLQPSVSLSVSLWSQSTVKDDVWENHAAMNFSIYCNTVHAILCKLGLCSMVMNMIDMILIKPSGLQSSFLILEAAVDKIISAAAVVEVSIRSHDLHQQISDFSSMLAENLNLRVCS